MDDGVNWTNRKFRKLNQSKIQVFRCPGVSGISGSAIMKKLKITTISWILIIWKNFKVLTRIKFGLQFSECWWKWNISVSHYEKIEKWPPFHKYWLYGKISNYLYPPKVWVSGFLSVDGNGIAVLAIMKKLKNGQHINRTVSTETEYAL